MTGAVAYLGLGSNLGDSAGEIREAVRALDAMPGIRVEACSSLYRTAPVGDVDQPDFINAVCRVRTTLAPRELLAAGLTVEARRGRRRGGGNGGPRLLDIDVLLYGERVLREDGLVVPHPRLHQRAFVLYPLAEIAPSLEVPGHGPVEALRRRCAGQRIERLAPDAAAAG